MPPPQRLASPSILTTAPMNGWNLPARQPPTERLIWPTTLVQHLDGTIWVAMDHCTSKACMGTLSCARAVLGALARLGGRVAGVRVALAGLRIRISAGVGARSTDGSRKTNTEHGREIFQNVGGGFGTR